MCKILSGIKLDFTDCCDLKFSFQIEKKIRGYSGRKLSLGRDDAMVGRAKGNL